MTKRILWSVFLFAALFKSICALPQQENGISADSAVVSQIEQLNARAFESRKSDPVASLSYSELSLSLSRKAQYITGEINALSLMGMVYKNIGALDKAIAAYLEALRIADENGDQKRVSSCLNNIGSVFQIQGDFRKALKYYHLSLNMEEKLGDKEQLSIRLYNLGVVYEALDSLNIAYTYYYNSLLIEEQLGNKEGIYYALYGITGVETKMGRFESAMNNISRALRVAKELDDVLGISVCYAEMGKLYLAENNTARAIQSFDSSLYYAKPGKLLNELKEAHLNLSQAWARQGNYQKAFEHLSSYVSINDSLNNLGVKSRVAELEARYEVDRKEKEIINLKEVNQLKTQKADSERRNRNFLLITVLLAMVLAVYNLRKIAVDIRKTILLALGILGILILISLGLVFSGIYTQNTGFDLFFVAFADVLTYSVLPIFILIFLAERILLSRYLKKAGELTAQIKDLKIPEENRTLTLNFEAKEASMSLDLANLICFEAQDNYTAIYYLKDRVLKRELHRSSLRRVEEQLTGFDEIVRCHKSYIINIQQVSHVSGNAQGYKLHIQHLEFSIPVSRSFPQSMIERLKRKH